ncbi:MAG: SulP family inorganic anion transporter [Spirochaetales bacterium]|nr:SulP family inorganic anion transporter [Spirochaetales bacterium]
MKNSKGDQLFPIKLDRPKNIKNDLLSGFTVALALVPEAIAFAFIVGVNPTIGLYAAFMMGLITALIGGRPGMITGATGAVALVFKPMMEELIPSVGMNGALGYLFAAVIIMGLLQILFGVLKLGKFIRLVPHPVMLGFVNGLAIVIFRSQFDLFFTGDASTTREKVLILAVMGGLLLLTMGISYFLPKLTKAIPATLAAIVVVSGLSVLLKHLGIPVLTVIDFVREKDPSITTLASSLPRFAIPSIPLTGDAFKLILPFACQAAAVGLIESLMTLTLVDELTDTRGRGNKECIGQGVANVVNGFFGGMGGCAMIGQSVINIRAGGRGRLSGVTAALGLLGFVLFGAPLIENIPLAALVGVMFMVVIGTFEWSSFRIIRQIPFSDALIIILVSVVTVVEGLAEAVAVGIVLSALIFAWKKGQRFDVEETVDEEKGTKVYKLGGTLFFGSVASFKEIFHFAEDPEHVVIDFENARVHDHSGLEALNFVAEKYTGQGKKLHLLNLSKECKSLVKKAGSIVEITEIEGMDWFHLAEDSLA